MYPSVFSFDILKPFLYVETAVCFKSYPTEIKAADCFVYDYLKDENRNDLIQQYDLEFFEVNVQQINRTFIDKVFAVGDYYLSGNVKGHSRHIYDLYKIYPQIKFDDNFKILINEVWEIRKLHKTCLSARDDVDLQILLQNIINEHYYKFDYNNVAKSLLFDNISYKEALSVLQNIIDSNYFKQQIKL